MPFQIIRNDITKVKADAIVNTANPKPVIGSGTDSAIYHAAGEVALLAERRRIGNIAPGSAAATPAFRLQAKHIIHTVGPVWMDGSHGERDILRSCYAKSLALAAELCAESIAFPLIATGVYGFPKDEALSIALSEISRFLLDHDMKVIMVVFDRKAFELSGLLAGHVEECISDSEVRSVRESEYSDVFRSAVTWQAERRSAAEKETLTEALEAAGETFQQRLFGLIRERGMDEVAVYKRANIDRKVFSRIRRNVNYRPKKQTAVAFAVALNLDMPEMEDLLARAGFAFSPSSKSDIIIQYCVAHGIYNIFDINAALFKYDQPLLGY